MNMKRKITIKLRLSPLAWQIIKRDCKRDRFAYNIAGTYIYGVVKSQLTREPQPPLEPPDDKHTIDAVYISERDFERHGCEIRTEGHALISHIIERVVRIEICNFVAVATASGARRDTALKHYLFENDIDEQLNFHAVKKYYQRNCKGLEEAHKTLFADIKEKENQKRKPDVNF